MNYIDESNVQSITVTNVTTGGRETFFNFDDLAVAVETRGHDLIQRWGQDGVLTLTFEVDYAQPEVEADAYDYYVDDDESEGKTALFADVKSIKESLSDLVAAVRSLGGRR